VTKAPLIYIGSLLLLLVTVLASARVGQERPISDFPIAKLPAQLGAWRLDSSTVRAFEELAAAGDYLRRRQTYRHPDGVAAVADIKVTNSRIGSLRDYNTAAIASGWTPLPADTWTMELPGVPFAVQASRQTLKQASSRMYTLNWYVSPGRQALTLEGAALSGWWARITGQATWGQVYLSVTSKAEDPQAEDALTDLASRIFPAFYKLLTSYAPHHPKPAPPARERGQAP